MKKLLSKLAVCLIATALVLSPLVGARQAKKADAATKRTAVVTSLLTNKGKINAADWTVVGDKNNIDVSNNGKVFKVTNATWPGYRIFPYATVPANTGYFVEMDVLKTNPATTKLNLSGYVTNFVDRNRRRRWYELRLERRRKSGVERREYHARRGLSLSFLVPHQSGRFFARGFNHL